MNAQAQVNANSVERWSLEDVVEKRAISRMLLELLVKERKYDLGAELVAGAGDEFRAYQAQLERLSSGSETQTPARLAKDLESLMITARSEIAYQQVWSERVLAALPQDRDTNVLRAAFAKVGAIGARLLQAVDSAASY